MPLYDDETKYSVKETSRILGISEQSLRYYDRIGLLAPYYRDPDNLYRYYTINQFYQLEMFKYAKWLGLPVPEYRSIFITKSQIESGDYSETENALSHLLEQNIRERERLDRCIADIERMQLNMDVLKRNRIDGEPFAETLPLRCAYAIDHNPDLPFEQTSIRMRKTRTKYQDHLTEHYGFLLNAEAARKGHIEIVKQYVVLDAYFDESDEIIHLPEGTYANFLYHGFCPEEHMASLSRYLENKPLDLGYLIADEVNFYDEVKEIIHAVRVPE